MDRRKVRRGAIRPIQTLLKQSSERCGGLGVDVNNRGNDKWRAIFSVEPIEPPMDRWKGRKGVDTSISGLRNCMNGGLIDSNEEGGGSGYY